MFHRPGDSRLVEEVNNVIKRKLEMKAGNRQASRKLRQATIIRSDVLASRGLAPVTTTIDTQCHKPESNLWVTESTFKPKANQMPKEWSLIMDRRDWESHNPEHSTWEGALWHFLQTWLHNGKQSNLGVHGLRHPSPLPGGS